MKKGNKHKGPCDSASAMRVATVGCSSCHHDEHPSPLLWLQELNMQRLTVENRNNNDKKHNDDIIQQSQCSAKVCVEQEPGQGAEKDTGSSARR